MAYSVKKAGVEFKVTVDLANDLAGKEANFSTVIKSNSTGLTTGNTIGAFTELVESPGTYQANITIPTAGDYTVIISNPTDGLESLTAPLVITNATVDDVKSVVDDLVVTLADVETQVNTLDTDGVDVLLGTANDGIADDTVFGKIAAAKAIVDGNKVHLEDAGYGLSALQVLLDSTSTEVSTIADLFADGGVTEVRFDSIDSAFTTLTDVVDGYQATLISRFDTIDSTLATADGKLNSILSGGNTVRVFV
jgi:hypothetical protein